MSNQNNLQQFDEYLEIVINHLQDRWFESGVGVVAAGAFTRNTSILETSWLNPNYRLWVHAERRVLDRITTTTNVKLSQDIVLVSTLSPCMRIVNTRFGPSCSSIIDEFGINTVHSGILDDIQVSGIVDYKHFGFQLSITKNKYYHSVCKKLQTILKSYNSKELENIHQLKMNLKMDPFQRIL